VRKKTFTCQYHKKNAWCSYIQFIIPILQTTTATNGIQNHCKTKTKPLKKPTTHIWAFAKHITEATILSQPSRHFKTLIHLLKNSHSSFWQILSQIKNSISSSSSSSSCYHGPPRRKKEKTKKKRITEFYCRCPTETNIKTHSIQHRTSTRLTARTSFSEQHHPQQRGEKKYRIEQEGCADPFHWTCPLHPDSLGPWYPFHHLPRKTHRRKPNPLLLACFLCLVCLFLLL